MRQMGGLKAWETRSIRQIRPVMSSSIDNMLKVCLGVGLVSEVVKVLSVMDILPMVEPVIQPGEGGAQLAYTATGAFSPYLEMAHLPLELRRLSCVLPHYFCCTGRGSLL